MTINNETEWNLILYNKELIETPHKGTSLQEHFENLYCVEQKITQQELVVLVFNSFPSTDQISIIKEEIINSVDVYFNNNTEFSEYNKEIMYLIFVNRLINIYIQKSYTGPKADDFDFLVYNLELTKERIEKLNKLAYDDLRINGEDVYSLAPNLFLFWLIGLLIDNDFVKGIKSINWWSYRYYWLYQRLLDELNPYLKEKILNNLGITKDTIEQIESNETLKNQLSIYLYIELGMVHEHYFNNKEAIICFGNARQLSGLKIKLTGALGKRTKFQKDDEYQLILFASSNSVESVTDVGGIPENHGLDDDTYYDQVQYTKTGDQDVTDDEPLNPIDQCIIINLIKHIKFTNPHDNILKEQMRPYIDRILKDPVNWQTYTMGLLARCRIENDKGRTVERSLFQLEELVKQIDSDPEPLYSRIRYFFQLMVPSKWEFQKELAQSYLSLGMIRSALELFKKWELFDNVIDCFILINEVDDAISLVDSLILRYPNSPKYLSLKGDILEDPQYWNKAWILSEEKYSRSMRSLGYYYYRKKDFETSVKCFLKSLELNYLFENAWFVCGCAALNIENWKVASRSFVKVVAMNDHNSEAWNNLATIYLKTSPKDNELELVDQEDGQTVQKDFKKQAYISLRQAHKLSPENWKISSNFLLVCLSLHKYQEAIPLFTKVINANVKQNKDSPIDLEILGHLISVSTTQNDDQIGQTRLISLIDSLIDTTILPTINNRSRDTWLTLSIYYKNLKRFNRHIETLLNAYRCLSTDSQLLFDQDKFVEIVSIAFKLVDAYKEAISYLDSSDPEKDENSYRVQSNWTSKTKMMLRSLKGKSEDAFGSTKEFKDLVELIEFL